MIMIRLDDLRDDAPKVDRPKPKVPKTVRIEPDLYAAITASTKKRGEKKTAEILRRGMREALAVADDQL